MWMCVVGSGIWRMRKGGGGGWRVRQQVVAVIGKRGNGSDGEVV